MKPQSNPIPSAAFFLACLLVLFLGACDPGTSEQTVNTGNFVKRYGFVDKQGKLVIPCQFDYVRPFSEGLAAAKKGLWGYIDRQGEWVVKPTFENAQDFSEGRAVVSMLVRGQFAWGYIDKTGQPAGKLQYKKAFSFSDGFGLVLKDSLWGFLDSTGAEAIPPQFADAKPFSEGLAPARPYGKGSYGYLGPDGNFVLPPKYPDAFGFHENRAWAGRNYPGYGILYAAIDRQGNAYTKWDLGPAPGDFSGGMAPVRGIFIDSTGRNIEFDPPFKRLYPYADGMARFHHYESRTSATMKYGYLNSAQEEAIPPKFTQAADFSEGMAAASADGKTFGFIDKSGNWVIPPDWADALSFGEGMAPVAERKEK